MITPSQKLLTPNLARESVSIKRAAMKARRITYWAT
jgi:hypothetical protein